MDAQVCSDIEIFDCVRPPTIVCEKICVFSDDKILDQAKPFWTVKDPPSLWQTNYNQEIWD